jgi:hypothetical protein
MNDCGRVVSVVASVSEQPLVRVAVADLRHRGFATAVHIRSVSRRRGRPEPMWPLRVAPGVERAVTHRAWLRRGKARVLATAEFDGDAWRFLTRLDRGSGCPLTDVADDVSEWLTQAISRARGLPGTYAASTAWLGLHIPLGIHPDPDGGHRRAHTALAEIVYGDDRARWSTEVVGGTRVFRASYGTADEESTAHQGERTFAFTSSGLVIVEQFDADGAAVWRHVGVPPDVIERLRTVPRPGEAGAPARALSHARLVPP